MTIRWVHGISETIRLGHFLLLESYTKKENIHVQSYMNISGVLLMYREKYFPIDLLVPLQTFGILASHRVKYFSPGKDFWLGHKKGL